MTTEKLILNASKREILGKKVKQLRRQGFVIGNIAISGKSSVPIQFNTLDFEKIYDKAGESTLVYLSLKNEGKMRPVLIDEVDYHAVNNSLSHVRLKQVSLTEKVEASVQLEIIGEFDLNDATLSILQDEIEVRALPTDLPENFEIEADKFTEIGQKFTLADLEYDKSKVELVLNEGINPEEVVLILIQEEKLQAEEPVEEVVETTEETASEEDGGEESKVGDDSKTDGDKPSENKDKKE